MPAWTLKPGTKVQSTDYNHIGEIPTDVAGSRCPFGLFKERGKLLRMSAPRLATSRKLK